MNLEQRINAFVKLGEFLGQFSYNGIQKKEHIPHNELFFDGFSHQIKVAQEQNGWFTNENIIYALESWSKSLNNKNIIQWIKIVCIAIFTLCTNIYSIILISNPKIFTFLQGQFRKKNCTNIA